MVHCLRGLVFLLFVNVGVARETQAPLPRHMSALGDSTSTGTLAQYKRSLAMSPVAHVMAFYDLLRFVLSGANKQALSDWKLSWTTGLGSKKVLSHAGRLKRLNPAIQVTNFAEPSARVERVRTVQLPQLKAWSLETYKQAYPDYLTVMVGANDLCADNLELATPIKNFLKSYQSILTEVLSSSPRSKVLVSALPPLSQLTNSGEAGLFAFPGVNNCRNFWKVAPLCKSITHGSADNTKKVAQKVAAINIGLKGIAAKLRKQYGDRVRFAEGLAFRDIKKEDLSIDCFHPNANAQADIANVTWPASWWK